MHVGCLGNVHQSFIKIFPVTVTSACSLLFTLQIHNSAHSPLKNLLTIFYQITFNVTETIKIVNALNVQSSSSSLSCDLILRCASFAARLSLGALRWMFFTARGSLCAPAELLISSGHTRFSGRSMWCPLLSSTTPRTTPSLPLIWHTTFAFLHSALFLSSPTTNTTSPTYG